MKLLISIFVFFTLMTTVLNHPNAAPQGEREPKNVILMIGDGMGIGQIEIARLLEHGKEGRLFLETLPYTALVHTYSENHFVTDSAAGGTAIAIGEKTENGKIGMTADGKEKDSILDIFKKHGKKTGIISTNTVTDATPAAFTASVADRWLNQEEIALQQLENQVDVLLGGGSTYFGSSRKDGRNLVEEAKQKGYRIVKTDKELESANGVKLLGLFSPGYMSFKIDRSLLKSQEPALIQMTEKAIQSLTNQNGFFLMVEGARIDHASHAGDLTGVWKETVEFDEAVKYAVEWAEQDRNTLVVVLADHETMGLSATEPLNIDALKKMKASSHFIAEKINQRMKNGQITDEDLSSILNEYCSLDFTTEEIKKLSAELSSADGEVYSQFHLAWEIGSMLAEKHYAGIEAPGIRSISSTGGHTGNLIPLFASGKGANRFHGVLDNTDVPNKILELMNYSF